MMKRLIPLMLIIMLCGCGMSEATPDDAGRVTTSPIYESTAEAPKKTYSVNLSADLQEYIIDLCREYEVPPSIVMAIIQIESECDAGKVGDNGRSFGLMQIHVKYHQERMTRLGVVDILDAADNVRVGIDYLAELYSYGRPEEWVLMAYNGGLSYATEMAQDGNVSVYARKVINLAEELEETAGYAE